MIPVVRGMQWVADSEVRHMRSHRGSALTNGVQVEEGLKAYLRPKSVWSCHSIFTIPSGEVNCARFEGQLPSSQHSLWSTDIQQPMHAPSGGDASPVVALQKRRSALLASKRTLGPIDSYQYKW